MKTIVLLLLVASVAHRSCHANQNEDAAAPQEEEDVVPSAKSADRWESMAESLNTLKERLTKLSPEYLELLESAKRGILSAKDSLLRHTSKLVEVVGRAVEGWKPDVSEPTLEADNNDEEVREILKKLQDFHKAKVAAKQKEELKSAQDKDEL